MARTLPPALAGASIPEPQAEPQKPTADTVAADTVAGEDFDDWGDSLDDPAFQMMREEGQRMTCLKFAVKLAASAAATHTPDITAILRNAQQMADYVKNGPTPTDLTVDQFNAIRGQLSGMIAADTKAPSDE